MEVQLWVTVICLKLRAPRRGLQVSSSVGICKEIYLITVGLTEANVATVLAGWLSK